MKTHDIETRTIGYREIMGTNHPVTTELRRTGRRSWVVTRAICNGIADGTSTEFHTLKAARAAYEA